MRKLLGEQFPPLDQCQSSERCPPRGFPQIGRESVFIDVAGGSVLFFRSWIAANG